MLLHNTKHHEYRLQLKNKAITHPITNTISKKLMIYSPVSSHALFGAVSSEVAESNRTNLRTWRRAIAQCCSSLLLHLLLRKAYPRRSTLSLSSTSAIATFDALTKLIASSEPYSVPFFLMEPSTFAIPMLFLTTSPSNRLLWI